MSMLNVYSIFDRVSSQYNTPFYSSSDAEATRNFARACQDPNVQLSQFPADFDLIRIAYFENDVGRDKAPITNFGIPVFIINGLSASQMLTTSQQSLQKG